VSALEDFAAAACGELELNPADVDVRRVLDLARDVAHAVERPAAPVAAYLLGLAVGHGADARAAASALAALAASWPAGGGTEPSA
jgi:hypothetical protein